MLQSDARTLRLGARAARSRGRGQGADRSRPGPRRSRPRPTPTPTSCANSASCARRRRRELASGGKGLRPASYRSASSTSWRTRPASSRSSSVAASPRRSRSAFAAQEAIDLQAAELKSAQEIAAAASGTKARAAGHRDHLQKKREGHRAEPQERPRPGAQSLEDEKSKPPRSLLKSNISLAEAIGAGRHRPAAREQARFNDTDEGQKAKQAIDVEIAARERLAAAIAGKSARESAEVRAGTAAGPTSGPTMKSAAA